MADEQQGTNQQTNLDKARDWVFTGTYTADVEFNNKPIKMKLLSADEDVKASQRARVNVGEDMDRFFLNELEMLALAIIEINGRPVSEPDVIRQWLFDTPRQIVRHLYTLYNEKLVVPNTPILDEVKN